MKGKEGEERKGRELYQPFLHARYCRVDVFCAVVVVRCRYADGAEWRGLLLVLGVFLWAVLLLFACAFAFASASASALVFLFHYRRRRWCW